MQRPMGVTILAILAAIGGVLGILAGFVLVGLSSAVAATDMALPLSGAVAILGVISIVVGVGDLAFAYGAWGLKPWAWMLGIVLEAVGIVVNLVEFRSATASSTIISVVISGAIIYYLYQPHVRRAFGQSV
ncbi:MAG: hypothetical protein ABSC46_13640 [Candidatus Limnocylindrales bacterium]|jgi:uncharacterized membrane protein (DUF2068 family)